MLDEGIEELRRRGAKEAAPVPVPHTALAEALGGGLWPGLYVITGPVASGKTQLLLSLAAHAAGQGIITAVHTPAATPAETSARLLGIVGRRSWSAMFTGETAVDDRDAEALGRLPLEVLATPAMPDKRLITTDRLRGPIDRSSEQTVVAAVDGPLKTKARHLAELAPHDILDFVDLEPAITSTADAICVLLPIGAVEPGAWWGVRLAVAKLRYGVPAWVDLRFNGTWFEEEVEEMEISLA